jgi:hypothetical protein
MMMEARLVNGGSRPGGGGKPQNPTFLSLSEDHVLTSFRVRPIPRTSAVCFFGKPQPGGDRRPGEGPGWVRVAKWERFAIPPPPPPFSLLPIRFPPVDRMWSYTGFPHPPGPC